MVLFLNGSDPLPVFTYEYPNSQLKTHYWSTPDYKLVGEDYAYAIIAKPGLAGMINEADLGRIGIPGVYLEKNSLDYRAWQADKVISYCRKKLLESGGKIIVYGHSEGFNVVARLLTVNHAITHAGLWAGTALPDYQDFMLFKRKDVIRGTLRDSLAARQLDTLLDEYRGIFAQPGGREAGSSYTYKRWISYASGSLEDLRNVRIPIYMLAATMDDNAPFENTFVVPLEFIRLGKTNLTWKVCVGCDHGFNVRRASGKTENFWSDYFKDMIAWTDTVRKIKSQKK